MKTVIKCMLGMVVGIGVTVAFAAPPVITEHVTPGTISYQGRIQTPDGTNYVDGIYGIEFRLYASSEADAEVLWGAKYKPYLQNGYFSVILGQEGVGEESLTNATFKTAGELWKAVWIKSSEEKAERHLGITLVETNGVAIPKVNVKESYPRQQLLASPFAIQAQFARQSSGNFSVGNELDVQGDIVSTGGNVILSNGILTAKSVDVNGDMDVLGKITNVEGGDLEVNDALTVSGALTATGKLTANDGAEVNGDFNVGGELVATNATAKLSALTVTEKLTAKGGLDLDGGVISDSDGRVNIAVANFSIGNGGQTISTDGDNDINLVSTDSITHRAATGIYLQSVSSDIRFKMGQDNAPWTYPVHTPNQAMRVVLGTVNSTGTGSGPGFTYKWISGGRCQITFTDNFAAAPHVVAMNVGPDKIGYDARIWINSSNRSGSSVEVMVSTSNGFGWAHATISFIAIGL